MRIGKQWLKLHYYDLNKTAAECAELKKCSVDRIYDYATKFGITKKQNGHYKDKSMYVHSQAGKPKSDEMKRKISKGQPNKRSIYMFNKKGRLINTFESINGAATQMNVPRENINKCLRGIRKSAGGYMWAYKLTYGEELHKRISNIDFSLPIEEMFKGVYAGLPQRLNRKEASMHYGQKLKAYWLKAA